MGQYQQWLRYQDIEQSLRKTQRALEEELAQLESQLDAVFFEQMTQHGYPLNSNPVISALLASLHTRISTSPKPTSFSMSPQPEAEAGGAAQAGNEPGLEEANFLDQLQMVFATLLPEEVEQFYAAYRQWLLQKRIEDVRQRLMALQEQLDTNETRTRYYRPSPIALASLARLQANGVNDTELLDQILERGETWLDVSMQRLSYCEQFENFLSDDYTQWCRRALDGAFDWIDSLRMAGIAGENGTMPAATVEEPPPGAEDAGEAEAMLLQKLSAEEEDDENSASMKDDELDVTSQIEQQSEPSSINETSEALDSEEHVEEAEKSHAGATNTVVEAEQPGNHGERVEAVPPSPSPGEEAARKAEPFATIGNSKKQGAVRRLVAKLWGE